MSETRDLISLGNLYTADYLKQSNLLATVSFSRLYDLRLRDDLNANSAGVETWKEDDSDVYEVIRKGLLNQDVKIQDQYTRLIDRFLTQKQGEFTTASPISLNDTVISLEPGHGFTDPPTTITPSTPTQMIEIECEGIQVQSRVIRVTGDDITVSNPFPCSTPAGTVGDRSTPDCNVDGSTTKQYFNTKPAAGVLWDVAVLSVNMLDQKAMDDSTFGGLDAPIRGCVYRTINDNTAENIFTAVDNSCYIRHCDTEEPYSDKAPAGYYGFNTKRRFNGQANDGVTRRIGGDFHRFEIVIQDDLTGLDRFWNVVRGHVVE